MEEILFSSYGAFVPVAVLTGLVAVPLGLMYLIYPKSILQLYMKYYPYLVGGFTAKSVQVGDHTISYLERPSSTGCTSATVVMFHGFTSSKNANVTMAKYFPPNWRVIFPDMPAHGDSSYVPNSDYSVHGIVDMLHEFFMVLNLNKVHLTGQSMGSFVAAQFSRQYPDLVISLSLLCPPVEISEKSPFWRMYFETGKNLFMPETITELDEMFTHAFYRPLRLTSQIKYGILDIMKPKYPGFAEVFANMMKSRFSRDESIQCISEITVPVLSVFGEHDSVVLLEEISTYFYQIAAVNDIEVKILENCGHAISVERPRKTAKEIVKFISKHSDYYC
ncbi:monoacylglycerol lipase ABHD6-like [Dysidea avara]|uniref:monoacylglycerol lipase ABHD6-like n=1 Tax=Dysidea avara TaxID=196820 RepID=UPI003328DA56